MLETCSDELIDLHRKQRTKNVKNYEAQRVKSYEIDDNKHMDRWSKTELESLIRHFQKEKKLGEIAALMNRSYRTICFMKTKYNRILDAEMIPSAETMRMPASKLRSMNKDQSRNRRKWSIDELKIFEDLLEQNLRYHEIARKLKRNPSSLACAAYKIRLIRQCGIPLTIKSFSGPRELYQELLKKK